MNMCGLKDVITIKCLYDVYKVMGYGSQVGGVLFMLEQETWLRARMKISVLTDILVIWFYGYIEIYKKI